MTQQQLETSDVPGPDGSLFLPKQETANETDAEVLVGKVVDCSGDEDPSDLINALLAKGPNYLLRARARIFLVRDGGHLREIDEIAFQRDIDRRTMIVEIIDKALGTYYESKEALA